MVHASLFSGIGGFDLAAEWAGWSNAFNCEIDPFCRQVLKFHFPNAEQYEDIKSTDFTIWRGKIDVLTGGFPCQPFSTAGKRKGTADNRYLWPEMLRAIREIRPRWVVGENVLGIVSWDGGMVFEQVQLDLEAEGYEVQAYVLPACGVNAPHQRYRTWFVANRADTGFESKREWQDSIYSDWTTSDTNSKRKYMSSREGNETESIRGRNNGEPEDGCKQAERYHGLHDVPWNFANANSQRWKEYDFAGESKGSNFSCIGSNEVQGRWSGFPTQSPVCSRDDGFPIPMDGITFPKWRAESIKAYGNAIVPQIAYRIFKSINTYEIL